MKIFRNGIKKATRVSVFGIVLILISILITSTGVAAALSNSGDGEWSHSKEIMIKENSGASLSNYQVLVELAGNNFPTVAKPNGDDVRFTDSNGYELSYWIEEWDSDANSGVIWVKVPGIPANGEAKIKMYYGNPGASAVSSGDATFEFFDDFDGFTIDEGRWHINHGDPSVSDGVLSLNKECVISEKIASFGEDFIFESFSKISETDDEPRAFLRSTDDYTEIDGGDRCEFGSWTTKSKMQVASVNDGIFSVVTNNEIFPTHFEVLGMAISDKKIETFRGYTPKLIIKESIPDKPQYLQLYSLGGETHFVEWARVRTYTSPEPTVTILKSTTQPEIHWIPIILPLLFFIFVGIYVLRKRGNKAEPEDTHTEEQKKTLDESKIKIPKTDSIPEETKNKTRMIVETLGNLAVNQAESGDKIELLNSLQDLKHYTEENVEEINNTIHQLEFIIKNRSEFSDLYVDGIKTLVHRIKREYEL
ncbi:MAG: DUF2341 domain-containing protein [Halobacteriota archaeon]|nr:DUF2341 domain-containing protein [Halobacteriota archaeon]